MQKLIVFMVVIALVSCGKKEKEEANKVGVATRPKVSNDGQLITFPDTASANYFAVSHIETSHLSISTSAPARMVVTVLPSQENPNQNIVLFDDPELTSAYTSLLQHLANINQIQNVTIKQRKIELDRAKDLQQHGAAAGREVLEAETALALEETNLANEKAANMEYEAKLKLGGFDPDTLRKAVPNSIWVLCDIPENQLYKISIGNRCAINFTSFPHEQFVGRIENVGDVIDHTTRMVKLRVRMINPDRKLKVGMFGTATFGVSKEKYASIPQEALVTVMGKDYVFVKKSDLEFERKEVTSGEQAQGNVIIYDGISDNDRFVVKGAMQLKGLSFGY